MKYLFPSIILFASLAAGCSSPARVSEDQTSVIVAHFVSDTVAHDTDDPAIWIHPTDPAGSLIVGTDKNKDGGLYVFNLEGKRIDSLCVTGLQRPNNVDIGYGFQLGNQEIDYAVTTERITHKLRFFSLPEMKAIDGGGIEAFVGEKGPEYRDLMGVATFKSPRTGKHYVIAGRKNGPSEGYLWQYEMQQDSLGDLHLELVRKFGTYSGKKEIEAIAVDAELGYVYYSDEQVGVRKYYSDPEMGDQELALFATEGFADDHEGISIYKMADGTGYILVSDQQANQFQVFPREGTHTNLHDHPLIIVLKVDTESSDGSEVTSLSLPPHFPNGLFVAMSEGKTFHFFRWEDLAGADLKIATEESKNFKKP